MSLIRLVLGGATGKTGSEVARHLVAEDGFEIVGAVGRSQAGGDLGALLGEGRLSGIPVCASVSEVSAQADLYVDFTQAEAAVSFATEALTRGLRVLIGTSGIDSEAASRLAQEAGRRSLAVAIIPNFALGSLLQRRMALELGRRYGRVEVVEGHHLAKRDAPSGTARDLRDRLEAEGVGVGVHSIRLSGLLARQEVWAGGVGEVLTVSHEVTSRRAYGPGVALAARRLVAASGFFTDLAELCPELLAPD